MGHFKEVGKGFSKKKKNTKKSFTCLFITLGQKTFNTSFIFVAVL